MNISTIKTRKDFCIMIAILVLIPFTLYHSSLHYDFIYSIDDEWIVISNPSIKMISEYGFVYGLKYLFYYDSTDFHYHPITYLSYSIDYLLFGINSYELKLHNLLLHISSGVLLFIFIHLLVKNKWIAFIVALVFLIHPMNIESIAWASCRRQALFYTYFLMSAIAYKLFLENKLKRYNLLFYFLAIFFWMISTLAKASAIVMPAIYVLLYIHKNRNKIEIKKIFMHLLPMLPFLCFFMYVNEQANARNFLVRDFSYSNFDHIIFAGYTYCFYWLKGLFPFPLVVFYPAPSEHLPIPKGYYVMFASSCIIIGLLIYHFIKKQNTLFFALGFYTITILPMLDLIFYPLGDLPMLVSNRYFYHTSLGIILYIVIIINDTIHNNKIKGLITISYLAMLVFLFGVHLPVWKNQIKVFENDVKYYPSEEFLYKLAILYDENGETNKALKYLDKGDKLGTDIWINNPWPYYQQRSKLYVKAKKYDRALNDINFAIKKKELKTPYVDSVLLADKKNIETIIKQNQ